ncbi:hypothetical protein CsatA_024135 [Cannabis sativa]
MSVKNFYSYDCYSKNSSLIHQNRTSHITLSKFFTLSDSENKLFGLGCDTQAVKNNTSVVVDWVVGNQTCEQAQLNSSSSSYVCGENTDCYYSENGGGYQCRCKQGYEGNPYLKQGCQDINECLDGMVVEKCRRCENTVGGYKCMCLRGMHGDERYGNCEGISFITIAIGVGIALGTFVLIFGTWHYRKKMFLARLN